MEILSSDTFKKYVSNVRVGLLNNNLLVLGSEKTLVCRSFFKVSLKGGFTYRFGFSNNCFSTFQQGQTAYPDRKGKPYRINYLKASLCDTASANPEKNKTVTVTFDGNVSKNVVEGEEFLSDGVYIDVEDGYLMIEESITGTEIPFTGDSQVPCFIDRGEGFTADTDCPKPAFIGCDRPYVKRLAFVGDSITQGCGTRPDMYEFWAARIAKALGDDFACANLGLGYARCRDFITGKRWFEAAKNFDIVVFCHGVNDILHEKGECAGGAEPSDVIRRIDTAVRMLSEEGIRVVLCNVPPFNFDDIGEEGTWRSVNSAIPGIAKKYGAEFFDIAAVLSNPAPHEVRAKYGPHPDGGGGEAIMLAFMASGIPERLK